MPFLTNLFGGKAFIGNPLPNLQRYHIPDKTNNAPAIKSIYPESKFSGRGNLTILSVYFAHRIRRKGITITNNKP
jgi:hypothetical protein